MSVVKLVNNFFDYFMGGAKGLMDNDAGTTDNMPRSSGISIAGMDVFKILDFMQTMYNLTK